MLYELADQIKEFFESKNITPNPQKMKLRGAKMTADLETLLTKNDDGELLRQKQNPRLKFK